MSTDTLRAGIVSELLLAGEVTPDELTDKDRALVAALTRILAHHQHPAVWTAPLVADATTAALTSLRRDGIVVTREQVVAALASAGITPGEVR